MATQASMASTHHPRPIRDREKYPCMSVNLMACECVSLSVTLCSYLLF